MYWTKKSVDAIFLALHDRQQACDYLLAQIKAAFDCGQLTAGDYLILRQHILRTAYGR